MWLEKRMGGKMGGKWEIALFFALLSRKSLQNVWNLCRMTVQCQSNIS